MARGLKALHQGIFDKPLPWQQAAEHDVIV
jgi:hypothetical protein